MDNREVAPGNETVRIDRQAEKTQVELYLGERRVSWLSIVPFTIRVGTARVRMDGIAYVGTQEDCRNRGYSRRLLEAAVRVMQEGDAALSMLYGIPDYYPKFGYATAGPEYLIHLPPALAPVPMPEGWTVREVALTDLPALQGLYARGNAECIGSAVRAIDAPVWTRLTEDAGAGECRVVMGPDGCVAGYVLRAAQHWAVRRVERIEPGAMVIGEVMAAHLVAADAALAACRNWAAEPIPDGDGTPRRVVLSTVPGGIVESAAMYQSARVERRYYACGESMARVLNVERLLTSLRPELELRWAKAGGRFSGVLRLDTDLGRVRLCLSPGSLRIEAEGACEEGMPVLAVAMPQTLLARLALGAFPPRTLLDRLEHSPSEETREVIEALFPLREPHMHLPDQF